MKVYIASSFSNIALVQHVQQQLKARGYVLTYDWTRNRRAVNEDTLRHIGTLEKQAVLDADVFIMLQPAGKGSHIEFGIALGLGKPIYLYAAEDIDPASASTFYYVDGVFRFSGRIEQFIEFVVNQEGISSNLRNN